MTKFYKRIVSLMLVVAMIVSMIPMTAKAQTGFDVVFVTYINGRATTDYSKLKTEGMKFRISKMNMSTFDMENVLAVPGKDGYANHMINQDIERGSYAYLYPENQDSPNMYGYRVAGADYEYKEGKRPIWQIPYNEDNIAALNTARTPLKILLNYELKYDLAISINNLSKDVNTVQFKLLDQNGNEESYTGIVEGDKIVIKNVEYNPTKAYIKLVGPEGLSIKVANGETDVEAKENDGSTYVLNPDFNNATYQEGKTPVVNIDFEEKVTQVTKPLNIPDRSLRQSIYVENPKVLDHIPNDVSREEAINNFYIYPSQVEYIEKLKIENEHDTTGIENLKNVNLLHAHGDNHKNLDITPFKSLEFLDLSKSGRDSLDLTGLTKIKSVIADDNNLSNIVFDDTNNMEWLSLMGNKFSEGLDFSKIQTLKTLKLSSQRERLSKLDITPLTSLSKLEISHHSLKSIDLSKNVNLTEIIADNNPEDNTGLETIDLSNNKKLNQITLKDNKLKEITLENLHLSGLNVGGNNMPKMDLSKVEFVMQPIRDFTQFIQAEGKKSGNSVVVDMSKILNKDEYDRVMVDDNISFNRDNGLLTLSNVEDMNNVNFTYKYITRNRYSLVSLMDINVKVDVKETGNDPIPNPGTGGSTGQPVTGTDDKITRIAGEDRYATSVALSKAKFNKANTVIIASGENYPDSLTGSSLASHIKAPILLSAKTKLPSVVKAEINRLNPSEIIVIGGENSIAKSDINDLKSMVKDVKVVAGETRYETSILVAKLYFDRAGISGKVIITSGENFADALAAGSISKKVKAPIILVNKADSSTKAFLKGNNITDAIVVGGTNSVADSTIADLGLKHTRLSGDDRFETSLKVAEFLNQDSKIVYVASGEVFPDAISAGYVAGMEETPLILVKNGSQSDNVKKYLNDKEMIVVGGSSTISNSSLNLSK